MIGEERWPGIRFPWRTPEEIWYTDTTWGMQGWNSGWMWICGLVPIMALVLTLRVGKARFRDAPSWIGRLSKSRCRLEGRCFPGMKGKLIPSSCWSDRSSRTWSMCPQLNRSSLIGKNGHQCQDSESPSGATQDRRNSAHVPL